MTYREQTFAERCYCDEPSTRACAACHRPRCDAHIAGRGLCHRCEDAVEVEVAGRTGGRWVQSGAAGTVTSVAALVAHVPMTGLLVGLVAAIGVFVSARPLQRRRVVRELGPRLAASVGEVRPRTRYDEPGFPSPGAEHTPPGYDRYIP